MRGERAENKGARAMIEAVDVLGLGNSLVDIIAHADDDYLDRPGHGERRDDADRRGSRRGALRRAPRPRSSGADRRPTPSSASPRSASKAPTSARSRTTNSATSSPRDIRATGVGFATRAGRARPGDGPLLRLRHARRRAHDEHLSGREHLSLARRRRRGPGALGALRLSRRLHVGPAGGQGGVPQGGRNRAVRRAIASR